MLRIWLWLPWECGTQCSPHRIWESCPGITRKSRRGEPPAWSGGANLHSGLTLGTFFFSDMQKDKDMLSISESAHRRFLLFRKAFKQVRAGSLPPQQKQASLNCHRGVPHRPCKWKCYCISLQDSSLLRTFPKRKFYRHLMSELRKKVGNSPSNTPASFLQYSNGLILNKRYRRSYYIFLN